MVLPIPIGLRHCVILHGRVHFNNTFTQVSSIHYTPYLTVRAMLQAYTLFQRCPGEIRADCCWKHFFKRLYLTWLKQNKAKNLTHRKRYGVKDIQNQNFKTISLFAMSKEDPILKVTFPVQGIAELATMHKCQGLDSTTTKRRKMLKMCHFHASWHLSSMATRWQHNFKHCVA